MKKPRYKFYFRNFWRESHIDVNLLPEITVYKLQWKDKFNSPRVETTPGIFISWLGFQWTWSKSENEVEKYLWATKYSATKNLEDYPWKQVEWNKTNKLL